MLLYLIVIILVITIIVLYLILKDYIKISIDDNNDIKTETNIITKIGQPMPPPINPLREYDRRALMDPLVAPLKRDDYNIPIIPIPTRGLPTAYKKMGTLIDKNSDNNDPYKFLFLMGRRKYPNSDYYEYYVTETKDDHHLKFKIQDIHKLFTTGETLNVSELDKNYEVHMDDNLGFEYNPYII